MPGSRDDNDQRVSPARIRNPEMRHEVQRAFAWALVIGLVALAIYVSQALLVVFAAMVFAAIVDGGSRLLGRVLDVGRTLRITIVLFAATVVLLAIAYFAGTQIAGETAALPEVVERQARNLFEWARAQGFAVSADSLSGLTAQLSSGLGTVTQMIGGLLGGLATLVLILIIGVYVAYDPALYERGVSWVMLREQRKDFHVTVGRMAYTMRRLMAGRLVGMAFEGVFTYVMLALWGVPLAASLALATALLAFIPNIGAVVSGVLMVMVGFSEGVDTGLYTIFVYFLVQTFDGYVVIPMIAKKTVDLAPALVLAFQLVMGLVFGILGLLLADPLLAMIKVYFERRSEIAGADPATATATGVHDGT